VRRAQRRLACHPSPLGYSALAREHALEGGLTDALRVCEEGLSAFPGSGELVQLAGRVRAQQRHERLRELRRELADAPRPALWRELAEASLDAGQLDRAEAACQSGLAAGGDGELALVLAQVRLKRFLEDRNLVGGRLAFDAMEAAVRALSADARPLRLGVALASRVGAWEEARRLAQRLLEVEPGDPALEACYRSLEDRAAGAPSVEAALREVERTGSLHKSQSQGRSQLGLGDLRPLLVRMAAEQGVHAAMYLRGGTALVQGVRGMGAERSARAARSVIRSGRKAARRLGLGPLGSVRVDSARDGSWSIAAGERDAGVLWCEGEPGAWQESALADLAGSDARLGEGRS